MPDNKDCGWLELMEKFPAVAAEYVNNKDDDGDIVEAKGIYGDGKPFTVNTYNGEDALSQVLQYVYFTLGDETYIVLQIHGGADVRGGYSTPMVFRVGSDMHDSETVILDNMYATIYCNGVDGSHNWMTENAGYNWLQDGGTGGYDLSEFEIVETELSTDDTIQFIKDLKQDSNMNESFMNSYRNESFLNAADDIELSDDIQYTRWGQVVKEPELDVIYVDNKGIGYCPLCGGQLEGYSY